MNYLNENIDSLNKKLASGDLSADKLAKDTVANIKDTDKKLNAWITVLADAKPAENLDYSKSKLAGIPIAIKDNIITNGVKTTAASHILYNYMPMYDATVISKLKKAGATFVGKTNMDEFAMGSSTEHSYYGATHNPWNLDKVPGGSSGGSAAAVASGQVVAALGSDTGGSIRQPAAFNGIFGIKPTYGRVSRWGLIAFGSSLDQIGVMTKRVKDSAEVLNVIAGADDHDSTVSTREVPDFTKFIGQDVKGLRVAVPKEYMEAVSGEMREVIQKQIDALKDAGAVINEVSLPHTSMLFLTTTSSLQVKLHQTCKDMMVSVTATVLRIPRTCLMFTLNHVLKALVQKLSVESCLAHLHFLLVHTTDSLDKLPRLEL